MMNMTLQELLDGLEKQAGLNKQAAEEDMKDKKDGKKDPEKDERDDESKAKEDVEKAKKDVDEAAEDVEKAEKENGKEEEQCKEARLKGAALAQEVMSKVAALKVNTETNKEPVMKKEAAAAGQALAEALLTKLANAGDVSTENGVTPGSVPQKNIVDAAQIVAEDDAKIKPMPTGDGIKNEGSINQILDGIVADAISQGATSYGQGVEAKARGICEAEGDPEETATPNQVEDEDEREKAAAVSSLVNDGYDFESAVEMVKAAAEELEYEETMQIKQAALGALLDRGVDFDTAVDMVKKAGALVPAAGRAMTAAGGAAKKGLSRGAKMAIGAGVAGAAGGAALAAKRSHEKKAALDALVESGVDFDQALELVNAKAAQIYGA
jgi:hypothetical protein